MKKKLSILTIVLGLLITLLGVALLMPSVAKTSGIKNYGESENLKDGDKVYITGKLVIEKGATDDDLNICTDSLVLIRNVEMVSYIKDGNEAKLVLSNHQIESFEINGTKYENALYPTEFGNKVFCADATINGVALDDAFIERVIAQNSNSITTSSELIDVDNLPAENGNSYNLSLSGNSYVTASDEWEVGDIKVSYQKSVDDSEKIYTIIGKVQDNEIVCDENSIIIDSEVSLSTAKKSVRGSIVPSVSLIAAGLLVSSVGLVLKKKKSY